MIQPALRPQVGYAGDFDDGIGEAHDRGAPHPAPESVSSPSKDTAPTVVVKGAPGSKAKGKADGPKGTKGSGPKAAAAGKGKGKGQKDGAGAGKGAKAAPSKPKGGAAAGKPKPKGRK